MNTAIHILALVALAWGSYYFFNTVGEAPLGVVLLGLALLWLPFTLQALVDDYRDITGGTRRRR